MLAYKNDSYIPLELCNLSVYDLGVLMGAGVTDLVRTFNGIPWMLGEHIDRLFRSCKYACIPPGKTKPEVKDIVDGLIKENYTDKDLAIVFYVTPGENPIYAGSAGISGDREPTFIVHTFPLQTKLLWKRYFTEGIHLVTPHIRHIPPNMFDSRIKHRNRLHMWMAEQQLQVPGAVALYLEEHGYVTETGGANVAIYSANRIVSPVKNRLDGLGLRTLFDAADKQTGGSSIFSTEMWNGYGKLTLYDLLNADEVWLTTTPYCLAPVCWINGQDIGNGQPGPVWRKLLNTISDMVGKDVYKEIIE